MERDVQRSFPTNLRAFIGEAYCCGLRFATRAVSSERRRQDRRRRDLSTTATAQRPPSDGPTSCASLLSSPAL